MDNVVVVGASLAGFRAVEELRHLGYDGRLTVIGAESHLPYDRPPLSKQVLSGKWELDRIALRPIGKEISDLDVDWQLGVAAIGLFLGRQAQSMDTDIAAIRRIFAASQPRMPRC